MNENVTFDPKPIFCNGATVSFKVPAKGSKSPAAPLKTVPPEPPRASAAVGRVRVLAEGMPESVKAVPGPHSTFRQPSVTEMIFVADAIGVLWTATKVENVGTTTRSGRSPSVIPRREPKGVDILTAGIDGFPDVEISTSLGAVFDAGFATVNANERMVLLLRL